MDFMLAPDATPALRLLCAHLLDRAAPAQRIARLADEAWQEWLERPAYARRHTPQVAEWLDSERQQAAVLVAVAMRATWCTVELDVTTGTVAVLVGLA